MQILFYYSTYPATHYKLPVQTKRHFLIIIIKKKTKKQMTSEVYFVKVKGLGETMSPQTLVWSVI